MQRQPRQYRLERVPAQVRAQHAPEAGATELLFPMTVKQISQSSGVSVELIRRRLNEQRIRSWPRLVRSPAAAKRESIANQRRLMAAAKAVDIEDAAREHLSQERIRLGHRKL